MADGAADAIAALDALIERVREAARRSVADEAALIEGAAKEFAHVKTGTLRRSILPTPVHPLATNVFESLVGPTVVYGRQKELGGHIFPVRARALRFIARDGALVFAAHVYQPPIPFLKPGYQAAAPRFTDVVLRRVGAAILSI